MKAHRIKASQPQTRKGHLTAKREMLGRVELRNERTVYKEGSRYLVEQIDGRGQLHTDIVTQDAVDYLYSALSGLEVTSEAAAESLELVASQLKLPYSYGRKLQFYAQSVLMVLIILGDASVEKVGRQYHYTIH